jgi:uncharacterized protein YkwD
MRTRARIALLALAACSLMLIVGAAPAGARPGKARIDRHEKKVISLINRFRASHRLGALRANPRLARSADAHSQDMLAHDFFAHDSSDGSSFGQRVRQFIRAKELGEVLAWSERRGRDPAPSTFLEMWKRSPDHRALLLDGSFGRIGVACRSGELRGLPAMVCTGDLASPR